MSEIIGTIFGRPKNDTAYPHEDTAAAAAQTDSTPAHSTPTDVAGADETGDTEAIQAESAEDDAEAGTTPSAEDADESPEPVADEAEDTDEDTADEDLAPEADDEDEDEDEEPVTADAEDAAVLATETEAEAPARPAAGTRGTVTVDDSVVAKVVTIVAGKIDGVHSLDTDGLSVEVDGDVATIKVSLVIEFGHAVKALAEQVRIDVIEAVEQFLGFDVAAVDVHVGDIHLPA